MALRDQPYLPLFVKDYLTDEKLAECSAAANGVYIRLMCLMHKSETYGRLLLKQKYKQTVKQVLKQNSKHLPEFCLAFACQLERSMPYGRDEIEQGLMELVSEGVCYFEGDFLCQKRMIKDNEISELRSKAGRKGGQKTQSSFASLFALAKVEANSENENEYVHKNENTNENTKTETRNGFENPESVYAVLADELNQLILQSNPHMGKERLLNIETMTESRHAMYQLIEKHSKTPDQVRAAAKFALADEKRIFLNPKYLCGESGGALVIDRILAQMAKAEPQTQDPFEPTLIFNEDEL